MAAQKIVLTETERSAAALAAQEAVRKGKSHYGVVAAVIGAVNNVRRDMT